MGLSFSAAPLPETVEWGDTGRVAGTNRFGTAVAIAQRSFPDGADVVYLARSDLFADALAGGVLTDGPVLLVRSCDTLPKVVRDELTRLDPDRVVALGGDGAVCDTVLKAAAAGRDHSRLEGRSRYDTAAAVAAYAFPEGPVAEVYLASAADESPDAVAGGALTGGPILLVRPDGTLHPATTAAIRAADPNRVVALGGQTVVPQTTLEAAGAGRELDRLSGTNRYGTAAAIAAHAFPRQVPAVYLARGDVFADAIAAGSLTDGPVLLVKSCDTLPSSVVTYLTETNPQHIYALGGDGAVCDTTLNAAGGLITPPADPIQLAPETEVLTPDELDEVEAFDPDTGTITLGGDEPSLASLTEGDIVVAGYTETVPTGFLRRVEDVTVTDTGYALSTTDVELPDAVADTGGALVGGEATLVASYVEPADGVEVVDGLIPEARTQDRPDFVTPDAVEVELQHTLKLQKEWDVSTTEDPDANFSGTGTVGVDATVKVGGKLETEADIEWFKLRELLIKAGPTADASLNAEITGELTGTADPELGKVTRIWHIQVGPVPVVMVETTNMTLEAEVTTTGQIGFTTGVDAEGVVGIHYKNDEVRPILEFDGTATPPSLVADATATVGMIVGPQTDLRAYGVAGLRSKAGPFLKATVTETETEPLSCTLTGGLKADLSAVAGINILGLQASMERGRDITLTLLDEELCEPTDSPDPEPVVLPFPGAGQPSAFTVKAHATRLAIVPNGSAYIIDGDDTGTAIARDGAQSQYPRDEASWVYPTSGWKDGTVIQDEKFGVRARQGADLVWANDAIEQAYSTGFGPTFAIRGVNTVVRVDKDTGEILAEVPIISGVGGQARARDSVISLTNRNNSSVSFFDRETFAYLDSCIWGGWGGGALFSDARAIAAAVVLDGRSQIHFCDETGVYREVSVQANSEVFAYPAGDAVFLVEPILGIRRSRVHVAYPNGDISFLGEYRGGWAHGSSESGHLILRDEWAHSCGPDFDARRCYSSALSLVSVDGSSETLFEPDATGPGSVVIDDVKVGFGQVWVAWYETNAETGITETSISSVLAPTEGDPVFHSHLLGSWSG